MNEKEIASLSDMLKSISHPLRLKILCLLQDREMSVGEIREAVKTTNANISQHLSIMRNQGVVGTRREANFIYNRIADKRIISLINSLQTLFCSNGKQA